MNRTYLITGAAGFIGSALARKLVSNGENVHAIIRHDSKVWRLNPIIKKIRIHYSDLSSSDEVSALIQEIKPSVIYHLATNGAYSYQNDASKIIQTNILGTWNLLCACNNIDYELFVNTGSSSEYGFKQYAMRETDILEPTSYYAVTKCAQTLLCSHLARSEQKSLVTLRPFSVYGPYEEATRFIPTLMKSLDTGQAMNLVNPHVARDFIYLDDLIDAYLDVDGLKGYRGEFFNIGTGVQSSIEDVVNIAMKITNKKISCDWGKLTNRSWDTENWVADISKARQLLKWYPRYTLHEGLEVTWKWFTHNRNLY